MKKEDWQMIARAFGLLTLLGIGIVVNIGIGFWLGSWLDRLTGHDMIFKITGLIIGIASGFYSDYRLISEVIGDNNDEDK